MSIHVARDGCRIHYDVVGKGAPVLLVPGLGGDGRFWDGVMAWLKDRYRLIAVDHRGAGRSDRPLGAYRISGIAADILGILDQEGVEQAHLVGHSTGGAIVQSLAIDAPMRCLSTTISGSWARPDARLRMLFAVRSSLLREGLTTDYQTLTHVLGHTPEWIEAHEDSLQAAVASAAERLAPLPVTEARIRMLLDFDRYAELGRITGPVMVIGAEDDLMIPFRHSAEIAAAIAGARLERLAGGHFHPSTRPEPFAQLLADFLGRPAVPR
ncbi:alpha/beta fold hydrolase [Taklimakanibacter lacteus]|uniref:alpha/beta fold hydrolase n=1 Tax=Taklimakanibacter lacteus TaxID=2268456 RepID=UPI000E6708F9